MKQSRYILAILSSLIVILLFGTGVVAGVIGDITGDGQVGIEDSIVALQVSAGISPAINVNLSADVNGNNRIGIEEAVYVLQRVAFLRIQRLSVGPEGGVLEFSNGVILDIPGGAVTEETEIGVPDIQCEQVNEILSAQGFASNERRCLGGFTGKPDGQEFLLPVTATVPILSLEPGEIPIQIKVNLDEQEYHLAPTNLRYLGEGAVAEMEIRGFSTNVVSASIQEETTPWTFPPPPCCLKMDDDPNSPTYGQFFLNTGKFEPDCCCFDGVFYQSEDSFLDGVKGDTYCAIAAKKTEVTLFKCPGQPKQTSWLQETRSDSDAMGNDGCPDDLKCKIDVQPSPEVDIFVCEEEKLEALISCDYKDGDPGLFSNADFEPFWRSSEETIAKVDPITGKVKGKGIGNATVEAAFAIPDPRFESGDTRVNVKSNIDSFSVTPSQATITFPNEITLEAEVVGAPGISLDPSKVTWSSSNDDIAYVRQETGEWTTVVGMGKGTVIITAEYEYKCETKVIWVDITVECPQITFQVNPPQGPLTVGEDFLLWAEVFGNNVDASSITWALSGNSDPEVVELPADRTGDSIVITAKKPGQVEIIATYDDGCQTIPEPVQITVECRQVTFTVDPPSPVTIEVDDGRILDAKVVDKQTGNDLDVSGVTWSSSDPDTAFVTNDTGSWTSVQAMKPGTVDITATYTDGCQTIPEPVQITVCPPLSLLVEPRVPPLQDWLEVGEGRILDAWIFDAQGNQLDASTVTWSSNEPSTAFVNPNTGPSTLVKGNSPGQVEITATYDDGCQTKQTTVVISVQEMEAWECRYMGPDAWSPWGCFHGDTYYSFWYSLEDCELHCPNPGGI